MATPTMAIQDELAVIGAEFQLRRDIAFLNHGSFGACPQPVFARFQEWQRELEYQPVEFIMRRIRAQGGLLDEARAALATFLGTHADNVVYTPNVTFAMNVAARAVQLAPGDEVLATDHEYGAVDRTWRYYCAQRGARYINWPMPLPVTTPEAFVERLWAGVTPRTRVIAISHITSPTGLIFPVAEICRRARAAGIITVIDGAHAPGQIALDLDALGADFYGGNCHKWLCSPKGAGFLYVRPEHHTQLEPLVISWGYEAEQPGPNHLIDYYQWTGTVEPAAYLTVPTAIAYQQERNWPRIRAACHELARQARERIAALTGLAPIAPDSPEWWNQLCTMPLPQTDPVVLKTRLLEEFGVEIPIITWQGQQFVRLSAQAYVRQEDIDRLVEGLAALLPRE